MILITPGKALGAIERPRLGFTLGYWRTRSNLLPTDDVLSLLPVSALASLEPDDLRGSQSVSALTSSELFYVEGSDHLFTIIGDHVWDVTSREPVGILSSLAATGASEETQYVYITDDAPAQSPFGATTVREHAQTITLAEESRILGMSVWIKKFIGSPTDDVIVTLYGWDGVSAPDTGIPYASAGIDNSRLSFSFQEIRVGAAVEVPAGQYALVVKRFGALDNSNFFAVQFALADVYAGGSRWSNSSGFWTDSVGYDMYMALWGPVDERDPDLISEVATTTLQSKEPQ